AGNITSGEYLAANRGRQRITSEEGLDVRSGRSYQFRGWDQETSRSYAANPKKFSAAKEEDFPLFYRTACRLTELVAGEDAFLLPFSSRIAILRVIVKGVRGEV